MRTGLLMVLLSVMAAEPALAQYREPPIYPYRNRNASPAQLIDQLVRRIDNDVRYRIISRADAQRLRAEADRLRRMHYQYGHDGISSWERSELTRRIGRLRDDVLAAEQGRFGRSVIVPPASRDYDDRDYDDRAYRPDNAVPPDYDRDDDRRDDDNRYDDRGYEDRDEDTPDFGQRELDDDPGATDDEPGYPEELRVGDRAPVNLGLLPPEQRGRYRDGNGVYYRYWNGTIYQVDDRTHIIRWMGRIAD